MNRLDHSCMALDESATDHFRYAAQNDDIRFAVRNYCLHFLF